MKELYLFIAIFVGLMLSGCTTVKNSNQSTSSSYSSHQLSLNTSLKTPEMIKVYPEGSGPKHTYKIIAKETVSKYNRVGIKRQEAVIHDALRTKAASLGGDAIINIIRDDKKVTGEVVTFENPAIG